MTFERPLAVVTGASSGIGKELARQFVAHGYDVVVAADEPEIRAAAAELGAAGTQVTPVEVDLATTDGVETLWREVEAVGRPVDAAALNAGVATAGRFAESRLEDHLRLVDLNVRATVHLAKRLVDQMADRGAGRILVTSSVVAVTPTPYQSTYAASKAFVHSFAEALRHELKGTGVTVTSLMPGPTDTRFFKRADMEDTVLARGPKDDPATVARDGFTAMQEGRPHVRAGSLLNGLVAEVATHLPDRVTTAVMALPLKRKRD